MQLHPENYRRSGRGDFSTIYGWSFSTNTRTKKILCKHPRLDIKNEQVSPLLRNLLPIAIIESACDPRTLATFEATLIKQKVASAFPQKPNAESTLKNRKIRDSLFT